MGLYFISPIELFLSPWWPSLLMSVCEPYFENHKSRLSKPCYSCSPVSIGLIPRPLQIPKSLDAQVSYLKWPSRASEYSLPSNSRVLPPWIHDWLNLERKNLWTWRADYTLLRLDHLGPGFLIGLWQFSVGLKPSNRGLQWMFSFKGSFFIS